MIEFLRIQNLALVDDLELEFAPGLNALTGETGAGKSFIMRAVGFLTGEKLDTDMVRAGADKARVEAMFFVDGEEVVIRRELSADSGRSRIYINDALSSQDALRELRPKLVLNVSQHGQQRLLQPSWQAGLVDSFIAGKDLVRQRDEALAKARETARKKRELEERIQRLKDQRDLLEFQKAEIDKVAPEPGEEEELLARQRELKDQAEAAQSVERCLSLLHGESGAGLLDVMRDLSRDMARLASLEQDFAEESQALDEYLERARDLDMRLRRNAPESQAAELEKTEARLYEFSRLKRKLNRSMEQILNLKREIEDSLSEADSFALDMKRLDQQEAEAAKSLGEITADLNRVRRKAGEELASRLEQELRGLGFPEQAKTAFEFDGHEIYPGVFEDRPRIIWIPNPGLAPQPLDRIASGGELSRFLLATVSLMARKNLPTLIFDEVDAGVGGITLNRVGERLADLASRQQLLLITHWPQLAVLANKHFHVAKEVAGNNTHVMCRALTGGEVQAELTRMAGGGPLGEAMARELLSE